MLRSNPFSAIGFDDDWLSIDKGFGPGSGAELGEKGYAGRTADESNPGWTPNPQAFDPFNTYRGVDPYTGVPIPGTTHSKAMLRLACVIGELNMDPFMRDPSVLVNKTFPSGMLGFAIDEDATRSATGYDFTYIVTPVPRRPGDPEEPEEPEEPSGQVHSGVGEMAIDTRDWSDYLTADELYWAEDVEITAPRDSRLPVQGSLAVTTADQGAAHIFAPRDAFGNKLPNPLNLYTDDPALGRGVVQGRASAAPGHLISDTKYYGPANAAEIAELKAIGLPPGARLPFQPTYDKIWGTDASAPAVRDAALSGSVATHNDLKSLRSNSIQKKYELPALRRYGGGAGALGIAGGAALFYGGIQQDDPILAAFGIAGGAVEVTGGAARLVGSFKVSAPLQQAGRTLGTAGAILTAPLTAHSFYDDLSKGDWFEAAVDASSFASAGLTVGGVAAGSAALTEGGLVLGSLGVGVLVGTGIDKSLELATKGALGVDLSPSALIAGQLTTLDQELTTLWSDPTQPAYTQSIAWKLLQLIE